MKNPGIQGVWKAPELKEKGPQRVIRPLRCNSRATRPEASGIPSSRDSAELGGPREYSGAVS